MNLIDSLTVNKPLKWKWMIVETSENKPNLIHTCKLSPFSAASFLAKGLAYTRDEDWDDEGKEIGAAATGDGEAGAGARAGAGAGAGEGLAAAWAGAASSLNSLNAWTSLSFSTMIHTNWKQNKHFKNQNLIALSILLVSMRRTSWQIYLLYQLLYLIEHLWGLFK